MRDDKGATGEATLDELGHGGWCMQMGPQVAIEVTIHYLMTKIHIRRAGRCYLWRKSLTIYYQRGIYYHNLGGMVRFELKNPYKY